MANYKKAEISCLYFKSLALGTESAEGNERRATVEVIWDFGRKQKQRKKSLLYVVPNSPTL